MAITVSDLQAHISVTGMEAAARQMAGFGQTTTMTGVAIGGLGAIMSALVTGPLVALGAGVVKVGVDYEKAMNIFQSVTHASGDEMARAAQIAQKLGADMTLPATSAGDAAKAMTELAKGGLTASQAMDAAHGTLMLAAAASISEARAAEIAANALNAFGLEASEAGRVSDLLAAAANASSAEINDIALSMQMASTVFKTAHISISDLTTSIALMANAGIKGSDAGTSLKTMMLALEAPTKKAAGEMKALGINIFDAQGNFIPFRDMIAQVEHAMKGLTDQQQAAALKVIFGTDAIRAANIVLKGGVEQFDKMSEAVNRTGAAQELAGARAKGLGGALDGLKSQLETIGLKIYEVVGPALESLVRDAAKLFEGFSTLEPGTIKMGVALAALAAAAGPVLVAVGAIVAAIGTIGAPIVAAGVAVAALATAYATNFAGIRDNVNAVFKDLAGFYTDHKTELDALATAVGAALGVMARLWAENAAAILDSLRIITLGMRVAAGDWGAAWTQFNEMAKKEQEKSSKQAKDWFDFLLASASAFANGFFARLMKVYEATVDTWAKIKDGAKAAWDAIADAVVGPIKRAYDFLKNLDWRSIFENMTAAAKAGLQVHSPPIIAVWVSQIGDAALKSAAQAQRSVPQYADAFGGITAAASAHLPKIAGMFLELGSTVIKILEDLKVKVPKVLDDIFGSVKGGTGKSSKAGKDAKDTGSTLGNMLVEGFGAALEGVKGIAAGQAQGGILGRLQGTLSGALAGAQIGAMFGGVGAAVGAGVGALAGFFLSAPTELQKAQAAAQLQQAKDAVKLSQQSVLQAVEQVKQTWITTLDKARSLLESIAFYSKVPKLAFNQFFADVTKLFDRIVELAKKWRIDATVDIKVAAENLGAGVALLSQLPAALDGISKYLGTPDASFAVFFAAAAKYFDKLEEFLETIPKSTAKAIGKFSNWLSSGVSLLGPLTEGLRGLLDLKDIPTDAQFALVDQAIDKIITHIGELGGKFDKGMLKSMAFFSEKAGAALALWKDTVDTIKATIGIQALTETDANNLISGLTMFIEKLGAGLSKLNTEELTRISAIAQTILPIAGALKAWADTSAAVRGYTLIASEAWDAIVTDFGKAITLMGVLIGQAQLFESMAITLEDHLKSGASHLADGISAMATGVLNTASALQSAFGHIQGGESTMGTASVGSSFGTQSMTAQSKQQVQINITEQPPPPDALGSYERFKEYKRQWWRDKQARAMGMGVQLPAFLTE